MILQRLPYRNACIRLRKVLRPVYRYSALNQLLDGLCVVSVPVRDQAPGNVAGLVATPCLYRLKAYPAFKEQVCTAVADAIAVARTPRCDDFYIHIRRAGRRQPVPEPALPKTLPPLQLPLQLPFPVLVQEQLPECQL